MNKGTSNSSEITFQLVIIGEFGSGKSSIIDKFTRNTFLSEYNPTLGFETTTHRLIISNIGVKLYIYDISLAEEKDFIEMILSTADGIFLVFDLSNFESLDYLPNLMAQIGVYAKPKSFKYLVANKSDIITYESLPENHKKQISLFIEEHKLNLAQCNCKEGDYVNKLFSSIIQEFLKKLNYI